MTARFKVSVIRDARAARAAAVDATAELDGTRYRKTASDEWTGPTGETRGDDDMLRGRLMVPAPDPF